MGVGDSVGTTRPGHTGGKDRADRNDDVPDDPVRTHEPGRRSEHLEEPGSGRTARLPRAFDATADESVPGDRDRPR